ncbi:MAG TPA: hypothetical protein VIQ24_00055, partial [Pyrinomonadaceae bacterium]
PVAVHERVARLALAVPAGEAPVACERVPEAGQRGVPVPYIENGALTTRYPPTMRRLRLWRQAAITVGGRPDWVFIKLHCHGMDPNDESAMTGELIKTFLRELTEEARASGAFKLHFTTAREMTNIILAACDGREGSPGEFRDYRLRLITPARTA